MASVKYQNFVLDPSTGNGNGIVVASSETEFWGRGSRFGNFLLQADGCEDITLTVEQTGKPVFIDLPASITIPKEGGIFHIQATTNASKIGFEVSRSIETEGWYSRQYSYSDRNGIEWNKVNNSSAVPGDPGMTDAFLVRVGNETGQPVPSNPEVTTRTLGSIDIFDPQNSSVTKTCTIYQAGGDPTLAVSPAEITLPWNAGTEGSTDTFTVTSNTNWTVS